VSILWSIGTVFTDYAFTDLNLVLGPGIISMVVGNTIRYLFAAITMLIMVIIEKRKTSKDYIKDNDKNGWIVLVISSFLVNILGTIAFTESVKILGASILSLLMSALPLFTIPLAYFINKEKISKIEFIGILLTIFGVIVIII
jgi:drug/metabolite transporter (DMT)-like permease